MLVSCQGFEFYVNDWFRLGWFFGSSMRSCCEVDWEWPSSPIWIWMCTFLCDRVLLKVLVVINDGSFVTNVPMLKKNVEVSIVFVERCSVIDSVCHDWKGFLYEFFYMYTYLFMDVHAHFSFRLVYHERLSPLLNYIQTLESRCKHSALYARC